MLKDNLLTLRNLNGFSQEQVAEKINVSRQAYAKWEKGETVPDIEKCVLLAKFYEVSIDSLVKTYSLDGFGIVPPEPIGKNIWGTVTVNERGQIVIPKGARDKFNLCEGTRLIVMSDENGIAMITAETFEENIKKVLEIAKKERHG